MLVRAAPDFLARVVEHRVSQVLSRLEDVFGTRRSSTQTFGELRRLAEKVAKEEELRAGMASAEAQTRSVRELEERISTWLSSRNTDQSPTVDSICPPPEPAAAPDRPALWRRLLGIDRDYRRQLQAHGSARARLLEEHEAHRAQASRARSRYLEARPDGIRDWLSLAVQAEPTIDGAPAALRAEYQADSRLLVLDYDVPHFDVIPEETGFRYVKQSASIVATKRTPASRRELYTELVSAVTLRVLAGIFAADDHSHVEAIVLNAYVVATEAHSGHSTHVCVLTVRVTRPQFQELRLELVDPVACLRSLSAVVSRHPEELVPIAPICNLDTFDRRFVRSTNVLQQLGERPNLLELSPGEFEALITNLFAAMGLETRLTQASRDGGVDCVAFDLRPVLGGKIVIQAKRYTDPVGVSAVRDLYGTVLNEGAGKGILVTTSGYGPAAYEFAANKPLELVSGGNLLALLAEWAGVEARIEPIPAPIPS